MSARGGENGARLGESRVRFRRGVYTYMEGCPPGRLDWPERRPPPLPFAETWRPVRLEESGAATADVRFPARSRAPREVKVDPL